MKNRMTEWLEARRIDAAEAPGAAIRLECLLREEARGASTPVPETLRAGVYRRLDGMPHGERAPRWPYWVGIPALAALVALMAIPWPAPQTTSSGDATWALGLPLNSRPVIAPAVAYMDRPLLDEANLIVRDTRRATRLVMECLPLPVGARPVSGEGG